MSESFQERAARLVELAGIFEQDEGRAPTAEDLAEATGASMELTLFTLHKLVDHGVLSLIPSAYDDRYAVEDEELLATLPDPADEPSVNEAAAKRKAAQSEHHQQIGHRFDKNFVDEARSKLFDEVRGKLGGQKEAKDNPLDGGVPKADPARDPEKQDLFSKLSGELSGKAEKKANPLDEMFKNKKSS
ncbi:MAG: hypothetical protein H6684_16485 [Deltaproteobacteria bacterium]|nr:hypothetical protein [bacterium]MCB9475779.1 hypothetical protein [Deltaproteobacteria bacterium]MCB9490331.1 hypothetical protein [Deltaproteobacteria bacterium]